MAENEQPFDPSLHTVDEVNEYLGQVDDEEKFRVLQLEANNRNRKGIVEEGSWQRTEHIAPEEMLKEVRTMSEPLGSTNGNQQPVAVTGKDFKAAPTWTTKVTPTNGVDGGDGTRASRATKVADNVWTPFKPLASSQAPYPPPNYIYIGAGGWVTATYNTIQAAGNNTATIASNGLNKF